MVASSLIDRAFCADFPPDRSRRAVAQLIETALGELNQIEKLDDSLAPDDPLQFDRPTAGLLRDEYERWASNTALLLERIKHVPGLAASVAETESLGDAYGKTRARLSITLDDMEESLRDLAEGRVVSMEEVRRERRVRVQQASAEGISANRTVAAGGNA